MNFIAVGIMAVVAYGIGWLWYSPLLFGNEWIRLQGKKVSTEKPGVWTFFGGFVTTAVLTVGLALFVDYTGARTFLKGAVVGMLLWFTLIATTMFNSVLYEGKSQPVYAINALHYYVVCVVVTSVLAVWQ